MADIHLTSNCGNTQEGLLPDQENAFLGGQCAADSMVNDEDMLLEIPIEKDREFLVSKRSSLNETADAPLLHRNFAKNYGSVNAGYFLRLSSGWNSLQSATSSCLQTQQSVPRSSVIVPCEEFGKLLMIWHYVYQLRYGRLREAWNSLMNQQYEALLGSLEVKPYSDSNQLPISTQGHVFNKLFRSEMNLQVVTSKNPSSSSTCSALLSTGFESSPAAESKLEVFLASDSALEAQRDLLLHLSYPNELSYDEPSPSAYNSEVARYPMENRKNLSVPESGLDNALLKPSNFTSPTLTLSTLQVTHPIDVPCLSPSVASSPPEILCTLSSAPDSTAYRSMPLASFEDSINLAGLASSKHCYKLPPAMVADPPSSFAYPPSSPVPNSFSCETEISAPPSYIASSKKESTRPTLAPSLSILRSKNTETTPDFNFNQEVSPIPAYSETTMPVQVEQRICVKHVIWSNTHELLLRNLPIKKRIFIMSKIKDKPFDWFRRYFRVYQAHFDEKVDTEKLSISSLKKLVAAHQSKLILDPLAVVRYLCIQKGSHLFPASRKENIRGVVRHHLMTNEHPLEASFELSLMKAVEERMNLEFRRKNLKN